MSIPPNLCRLCRKRISKGQRGSVRLGGLRYIAHKSCHPKAEKPK